MNGDNTYTKTFNGSLFLFEVKILPYDAPEIPINPDSIYQLIIEDDMMFWPKRGQITLQNGYDTLEKTVDLETIKGSLNAKQIEMLQISNKNQFVFRNDGKDRISIKIKPILNPKVEQTGELVEPPDEGWLIDIIANIYDKDDVLVNKITDKMKTLYFHDENYQKMLERNMHWSTATSTLNENKDKSYHKLKDDDRKMYTGDAVKDILVTELNLKVDEENFDKGSSKMFYTSNSEYSIWNTIDYMLSHHSSAKKLKSENNDICIFLYDDYKKAFQLIPLQDILSKAGNSPNQPKEYQIEHIYIEDLAQSSQDSTAGNVRMAPQSDKFSTNIDVKITKVRKYSFVDMAGRDSTDNIVTTAAYTYDFRTKTFVKLCEGSQAANIPDQLKNDYIQPNMLGGAGGASPYLNLNLNKIKNKKVNNVFTPILDKNSLNKLSYGKLLNTSIFLNQSLLLDLDGSTNRKIARFIAVDRMVDNSSDFDYKLCGQWLITYVKHNFFRNSYSNEVICVKPHTYKKINIKEDIE